MNKLTHIIRSSSNNLKVKHLNAKLVRLSSTNVEEKLEIPNRIPRGPTDILRALESTVLRDPTAAHYKYHDDPYLIPQSNIGKRTFALAQESGRKAAHWIREQHPELFQHKESDPPIEQFFPKMVYNENSEVTEQDLKDVIDNVLVNDAIIVYKLLQSKNQPVSDETLSGLLDLLCFYNNQDTLPEEFVEERWYRQVNTGRERTRKTWNDGTLAEEIFISIENPNAHVYSSMIQGMAKYYQVIRANQLFEEAQSKGLILTTDAYNSIIRVASFLKESFDLRWSFVINILSDMNKAEVKPNLGTLNAILETISGMGAGKNNKDNTLRTLKEFKNLGIEPSLASWYYVLVGFCRERGPLSFILRDILPHIENKEFKIRDIKDTFFFVTAMDVCRNHLQDRELGERVNKLLHYGDNYDLIGDSYKESIYYRHYFLLSCETEPLDEFMENVYRKLVPHIYVPEPGVMTEILKLVEMNSAVQYMPHLWSDMVTFDHTDREQLLELVLNIIVDNPPAKQSESNEQFCKIAWDIWNKIENQYEHRIAKLRFTGDMLGKIMTVVLRNDDFEKASLVMNKLDKGHQHVLGVPQLESLSLFVDHCIEQKVPSKAIQCIQYCADCGFSEAEQLATKLHEKLTLDENHISTLKKIIGDHMFTSNVTEEKK